MIVNTLNNNNNNNKCILCTVTIETRVPEFISGLYKNTRPGWDTALALQCALLTWGQEGMAQIVRRDDAATSLTSLHCTQSKRKHLLEACTAADKALTYTSNVTLFDVTADIWRRRMTVDKTIMNCG